MSRQINEDEAMVLYTAAVVGVPGLALELERCGFVEEHESLEEATALRPMILAEAANARKEERMSDDLEREANATPWLDSLRDRLGDAAFEEAVEATSDKVIGEARETDAPLTEEQVAGALAEAYEEVWISDLSPDLARLMAQEMQHVLRVRIVQARMDSLDEE